MLVYRKYGIVITLIAILLLLLGNLILQGGHIEQSQNIEINRFMEERNQNPSIIVQDTHDMTWVKEIDYVDVTEQSRSFFEGVDTSFSEIHIVPLYQNTTIIGYYRFAYDQASAYSILRLWNIGVILLFGLSCLMLYLIQHQVIRPFYRLHDMAISISKGNFNVSIPESKDKVFDRFIWAMNMLKDSLQSAKQRNLLLEKEKRTLVASLSHDIKTPVANIRLYAQALGKNLYASEEAKNRCLIRIYENTEKIEGYIQAVIQSSQHNIIDIQVHVSEVYLQDFIKKIKETQAEKLALYHTEFHCECDYNKLVCMDIDKSMEVIDNLIDNALKYGDGKQISIVCYQDDGCIIAIRNSGEPIAIQDISQLFQSFYRGSNVAQRPGNGLGLYIAKAIMKVQQGDLYYDQEQTMTTFCLRIPYAS